MPNEPVFSSQASLITPQPMPECAQEFSDRMRDLLDGKAKDEATVASALEGMDATLDAIVGRLYSLASMMVGEGEDSVRLVEEAIATTDISACSNPLQGRKLSRQALAKAAVEMISQRDPEGLAAPEGVEPAGGCINDDDLDAAGVSGDELERMLTGPDRDRIRNWLENLSVDVRTVFSLRAVAGMSAQEIADLLAQYGGPKASGWSADGVRMVFRQGLCSIASQLLQASLKS